ncbi:MAG: hypothetical protein O2960_29840 [Verrucomicrobia bacterium]|nr:hypothetical protein [Verrucomicrobiota bacterium]
MWTEGQVQGALRLGFSSSCVVVEHHDNLNFGQEATFAFWIKPESFGLANDAGPYLRRSSVIVTKGAHIGVRIVDDPGSVRWTIVVRSSASGSFGTEVELQENETFAPEGSVDLGEWQHFAIVYGNDHVSFFKNGSPLGETKGAQLGNENSDPLVIGGLRGGHGDSQPFKGAIDDFAIWKRMLTSSEIESIYRTGAAKRSFAFVIDGIEARSAQAIGIQFASPFTGRDYLVQWIPSVDGQIWAEQSNAEITELENGKYIATFSAPVDQALIYRVVALHRSPIFVDDFESGNLGWTHGGFRDSWELGVPTRGPPGAHSGVNVYGTNLSGPYSPNTDAYLRSPTIDLTGLGAATLTYWEYRELDPTPTFHTATVSVLDASTNEPLGVLTQNSGSTRGWQRRSLELSPESVCHTIVIEFRLVSDILILGNRNGWYIDDVALEIH